MNHQELKEKLLVSWERTLSQWESLSEETLIGGLTVSLADPALFWSPQDHLAHVYGTEKLFQFMIKRFLSNPMPADEDAKSEVAASQTREAEREAFLRQINRQNDKWIVKHRDKSFAEVVQVGEEIRAKSLELIDGLDESQLALTVPNAPWGGGSIAGIIGFNDDHAQMHWEWICAARQGS
ncbi:MAG: DinB family protein [Chloroflexota bacterium]